MFKVHLLQEDSKSELYWNLLETHLDHRSISLDINIEWDDLKNAKIKAAREAIGTKKENKSRNGLKNWNE